jgi:CIC family chloride channel protein
MIVSVSSYLTINIFEPHSIYSSRLAKEGKLITHNTDQAALTLMQLESVIDNDYLYASPDTELGQLVRRVSHSRGDVIPVLNAAGSLLGEIDISKIRHILFRTELYHHFTARQLMQPPVAILGDQQPMAQVMHTFEKTQADHLPVIDRDGHLRGYISRQRMFTQYRKMVADMSDD